MLGSAELGDGIVIADLEAGIGTLTRLGDQRVDTVVIVVEPTPKSIEVATRAAALVREQHAARRVVVAANRVRDDGDVAAVRAVFPDDEVVAIPDDPAIAEADRHGAAPLDATPEAPAVRALVALAGRLAPAPSATRRDPLTDERRPRP